MFRTVSTQMRLFGEVDPKIALIGDDVSTFAVDATLQNATSLTMLKRCDIDVLSFAQVAVVVVTFKSPYEVAAVNEKGRLCFKHVAYFQVQQGLRSGV